MTVLQSSRSTTNKVLDYPLNAWYATAWDHEVTRKPMARRIAGRPLALYRTEDGKAVALADACWHRLAPLSMGKTVGKDGIQCPYHGIVYNSAGRCASMPAQESINPSATVPSFPVIERHRFVWVWLGDPTQADPDLVPDMHQMDSQDWAGDGETIFAPCNYQLVLDNLMDLTHEEFVHASSIGQEELSESEFVVTHDDRTVTVSRWMLNIEAPPFWLKNMRDKFPGFVGKVDRWQIIRFEAPSTIRIDVGVAKAGTGAPDGDRSQGVNGYVMNTISPETAKTCHYFWAFMRNYRLDSQLITTQLRNGVHGVFGEDEAMLKAQQEAIDANPDYEFYSLNIDAGGMWVRRLIERMLQAEGRLAAAL
ncbi:aromatic ring-hydroxylating dioxygenase subunit alpha [Paenarthrobacter ureafaciens]|jgi:vanillate O-demethylase monooxygenase subunit|uniref:aromatic ring-hydroxylating dioxygenase subunit alpha n=1 Tax=Paenarthrobacter ureafaciens TaxID=37931 RepID=UPI001408321E|nr:aromatic ring-hydroxylating dioxygenase subunit alpha [Paenarthrobacter ureafaciens]MCX8456580.1 aromatic ring-hydroxylating dioxygenase subunit alpha [Paenarthrobacter ureafaciens]MCY0974214.1 aromatic ring-hydroxylating dioxygenase subunit alpha [Paenarthrobacter ureafaciens]UOD81110.1 aromatic ring-hydroxylating dioxygenase subunit alpha [Paenarthrobacter ureafaciens]WNZ03769.1 aromatic ring-hydroxylating dioxygenase subunit alpha [Paenarthrobacter ureafaciens]